MMGRLTVLESMVEFWSALSELMPTEGGGTLQTLLSMESESIIMHNAKEDHIAGQTNL